MTVRNGTGSPWRWPAMLAVLTIVGLLGALLGQTEAWWALSWIALAVPLACAIRALTRALGGQRQGSPVGDAAGPRR